MTVMTSNNSHLSQPEERVFGREHIDCGICGHKVDRDLIQVYNGYQLCELCKEQMIDDEFIRDKEEIDSLVEAAEKHVVDFALSVDEITAVIALLGRYSLTELNVLVVKCSGDFRLNSVLFRNMVLIAIENKKL
jgi:hypothetical protein